MRLFHWLLKSCVTFYVDHIKYTVVRFVSFLFFVELFSENMYTLTCLEWSLGRSDQSGHSRQVVFMERSFHELCLYQEQK